MKKLFFVVLMFFSSSVFADSLLLGGITIHGLANDPEVSVNMPRRFDDRGQVVFTPGIGYEKTMDGFSVLGSFLKDCYDNYAGTLLIGRSLGGNNTAQFGLYGGVYARETPYYEFQGETRIAKDFPWPLAVGDAYQAIPIVFLKVDFLPGQKIRPVILSNWGITEIAIQIEF